MTAKEQTEALKKLCKERGTDVEDLIDMISYKDISEILEEMQTHCNCGNSLDESGQEIGVCGECR